MSRTATTFEKLKAEGRKALIPYDCRLPFAAITPSLMHGMVEAGADVIELGVPFSDPMADGPVIQRAGDRPSPTAWAWPGAGLWPSSARKTDHPVVLMGYANPVERYDQIHGEDAFVNDAAAAGVDGVLIVDYPPEECEEFAAKLQGARHGPDLPAGPTSTDERMQQVAAWPAAMCTTSRSRA
jgi:tryptophan synthase alpha chain